MPHGTLRGTTAGQIVSVLHDPAQYRPRGYRVEHSRAGWAINGVHRPAHIVAAIPVARGKAVRAARAGGAPESIWSVRPIVAIPRIVAVPAVVIRIAVPVVPSRIDISGIIGRRVVVWVVEERVIKWRVRVVVRVVVVPPVRAAVKEPDGQMEWRITVVR